MCKWKLRSSSKKFKSFLPPSLVFYPTFFTLKFTQISCSKFIFIEILTLKKWGKKLVRGVKNFWIKKYKHSAFICTKNQKKIFKTRRNIAKWNLMTIKKKKLKIFKNFQNFKILKFWKIEKNVKKKLFWIWIYFKETYFREFSSFFNDFLCKWKLRSSSKKSKSFLPPSLVFYITFSRSKFQ